MLRSVFHAGQAAYQRLMASGLYARLVARRLLIPHADLPPDAHSDPETWCVLRPERVPFISYPFEWCFSQLRDAALATLEIQDEALRAGMTLKDASPENIQFVNGAPVHIDTLSFEPATGGAWAAYYQFCKRFLAPLALMAYGDHALLRLTAFEPDGIPLPTASALLPWRTWLRPSMALHLHWHARADRRRPSAPAVDRTPDRQPIIVDSLRRAVEAIRWKAPRTEWTGYETEQPTYSTVGWEARERVLQEQLERLRPRVVWDLGAALGHASRLAAAQGATTIAFDADPSCVELMWQRARRDGTRCLLPLVQNVLRPTPRSGWGERELLSLSDRGPAELLLVLGLLHHLTIRGGVPVDMVFDYFSIIGRAALVEFIPPRDPVVAEWCATFGRPPLTEDAFRSAAAVHFPILERFAIAGSARVLYLMQQA